MRVRNCVRNLTAASGDHQAEDITSLSLCFLFPFGLLQHKKCKCGMLCQLILKANLYL